MSTGGENWLCGKGQHLSLFHRRWTLFTILDILGRHNYRGGPPEADFDRPRLEIGARRTMKFCVDSTNPRALKRKIAFGGSISVLCGAAAVAARSNCRCGGNFQ